MLQEPHIKDHQSIDVGQYVAMYSQSRKLLLLAASQTDLSPTVPEAYNEARAGAREIPRPAMAASGVLSHGAGETKLLPNKQLP